MKAESTQEIFRNARKSPEYWKAYCELQKSEVNFMIRENKKLKNLLIDLILSYRQQINPTDDWRQTALTKREWSAATKAYREAVSWFKNNPDPAI